MNLAAHIAQCPGCKKRIFAPSEIAGRRRMILHFRKCQVIGPVLESIGTPADEAPAGSGPKPVTTHTESPSTFKGQG